MRYLAAGIAIVIAFVAGTVVCAYLPLGFLENGVTVSELKLSRVNLGGRPYYALTGYDRSDLLYGGGAKIIVHGNTCNIRIERTLINHGQRSGNFAYLFDEEPACSRLTFGERETPISAGK